MLTPPQARSRRPSQRTAHWKPGARRVTFWSRRRPVCAA